MLTRFVRIQLAIFTVAAVVGMTVMAVGYLQLPTLLGVGKITVTMDLPEAGGLYRFSNVTYRGVEVGKVTGVTLTPTGARATIRMDSSRKIPVDLRAEVRSVSAVGEQYVELIPQSDSPPYLANGYGIPREDVVVPQPVGPTLDSVSAFIGSIPKERLHALLDETDRALDGAGYDFESLISSSERISGELRPVSGRTRSLIEDSGPLLDTQLQTGDAIRTWSRSLAGLTGRLVDNDPQIRDLLRTGPGFAQEVGRLLTQVKPTLPVLLANLTTVGQVGLTYHPSLEQLLVLIPGFVAYIQSFSHANNPTGLPIGDFALTISDPPACTVGFLPPSQWRSPADTTTIDTPDDLYCKLPQDSPVAVRGVRNLPCMGHPGKRAPTVEICNSPLQFIPLALRNHALGPYPLDPNLVAQGVPPDDRITLPDNIYAPTEGTPLPPDGVPHAVSPEAVPAPGPVVPPAGAPASFAPRSGPSVAIAHYDPGTGKYAGPDGRVHRQLDLATTTPKSWQDMLPR